MKKILAPFVGGLAVVAAIADAYLLFFRPSQTVNETASSQSAPSQESSRTQESVSPETLKDGVYTGQLISTNRGDYQVQLTVASGRMAGVDVIVYPQDNPNSLAINEEALPQYTNQALANQSAQVDLVSGASEAFKGFTGSLQDAINQAQ